MSTKLGTILADFTTSLSTEISVGGTTATLATATDDDGVALPSGRYFFTVDGTSTNKEHFSCDLVGTALTNLKSLSRQGVETTGAVRKHRIGASVSLTDFGHIKFINDLISGATSLNSVTPLGYDGAPSSLTGNQLATVAYVLGVVNGGTVTFDKQVISGQTSGEALTANDIVYFKEADAKWYKADADLTATFDKLQLGVAQSTVSSNATVQIAISGPVSGFSGLSVGSKYYLSNTAGAISTSAGTYSVFVGWALSSTILLFNPIPQTLPTQKEKEALVGSQGTPSSSNTYVTSDNAYSSNTDQTQTTQNATIEIGEADTTGKKNKIAQSFVPTKSKIRGVNLYKSADTGTFTGTVTVSIQADSTGSPSGSALATQTITNANWLKIPVGDFEVLFSAEYSMTPSSTYWIVAETSTSDTSNHINIGTNSAGGYGSGSVKYKNSTDSWVSVATIDIYFKTLQGVIGQVNIAGTTVMEVFKYDRTWTKPTGAKLVEIIAIGAGGGGGSGGSRSVAGGTYSGGGGGGAGSVKRILMQADALNATEAVVVGAGGAGGNSITSADTGLAGSNGANSSFGGWLLAYGGKGGSGGTVAASGSQYGAGGDGGGFVVATTDGISEQGAKKGATVLGNNAEFGGGGGGAGSSDGGTAGGSSIYGSGAGGGGGGSAVGTGGAGGTSGSYTAGGGGAGGISSAGTAGGSNTSIKRGYGAAGGGGGAAGAFAGGAGGAGGGGGGGGGGNANTFPSGAGGVGGAGVVRVITYF